MTFEHLQVTITAATRPDRTLIAAVHRTSLERLRFTPASTTMADEQLGEALAS